MNQAEHCLERAAFIREVAMRVSVADQRAALLEVAEQWRRKAEEAGQTRTAHPSIRPLRMPKAAVG
ncbi:MAG TPA: hypothetical protein VF122_03635 [Caulobacteraceae bacterium]